MHNFVEVVLEKGGNAQRYFKMEIQMTTKPKRPSLVWTGSICGIFFSDAAVLSFWGIKGFINKEQKSSAVRLGHGSSGWSLQPHTQGNVAACGPH